MNSDRPHRRHRLKLDIEADSLGELAVALQHIGFLAGRGELTKKLTVHAHAFSASAREAIEKAGGTATVVER